MIYNLELKCWGFVIHFNNVATHELKFKLLYLHPAQCWGYAVIFISSNSENSIKALRVVAQRTFTLFKPAIHCGDFHQSIHLDFITCKIGYAGSTSTSEDSGPSRFSGSTRLCNYYPF